MVINLQFNPPTLFPGVVFRKLLPQRVLQKHPRLAGRRGDLRQHHLDRIPRGLDVGMLEHGRYGEGFMNARG